MRTASLLAVAACCWAACGTTTESVDGGTDGGTLDAGGIDAGGTDAGNPGIDAGDTDAGPDAGGTDAGTNDAGGTDAGDGAMDAGSSDAGPNTGPTYIKASNTSAGDTFGNAIALSADGTTLAVGAIAQTTATNGAGDVHVFMRAGDTWVQQAFLLGSNTESGDYFGSSVALSADGATLAVGAYIEDSDATGVDGDQSDNSANASGAVYVFQRTGTGWSQQAYVKASNTETRDGFGYSVALSGDGKTLAVGALFEASSATGVGGDQSDNGASNSGAVYVFTSASGTWSQQAYLKASNTDVDDAFGIAVSLSGDGATLAVGANGESSSATGVDGDQSDNTATGAGAVYVFTRTAATWSQQAYLKASNTGAGDSFGSAVSLSADGARLAIGAPFEASNATGVGGNQADDSAFLAGAVYVFWRSGGLWSQEAYVKASNTESIDAFGRSVSLSADGATLAAGAPNESSIATGIGGNQSDNRANGSGAVYVFKLAAGSWSQHQYVKASNTGFSDAFGNSVGLSADGVTLAVAAWFEDSNATGIDGDQADNSADDAGAVYVY